MAQSEISNNKYNESLHTKQTKDVFSLDLNLSYDSSNELLEQNGKASSDDNDKMTSGDDNTQLEPSNIERVFSCNYCKRKFYSSQALGGHQNAHKSERIIAKRATRLGVLGHRHVNSLASLPLNGMSSSAASAATAAGAANVVKFRPSISIQAHHGNMMMVTPQHQQLQEQHGYFIRGVPVYTAVPFWPGSFRKADDSDDSNAQNPNSDSFPDLTLKL